jgi:hypothetical protein
MTMDTYPKITLHEKHYFFISDQYWICANNVEPPLQFDLHPLLIFLSSGARGCDRGR